MILADTKKMYADAPHKTMSILRSSGYNIFLVLLIHVDMMIHYKCVK